MHSTSTFTLANPIAHCDALLSLNVEYMSWVAAGIQKSFGLTSQALLGMELPEYVSSAIHEVCVEPPRGAFYLVYAGSDLAGMGGLRRIGDGVAEIKRVYVRPAFRRLSLGQTILRRLLADAQAFGYPCVRLDSAPFMQSAQRMYAAAGFVDREPYEGVEVPVALHSAWRFMERLATDA